jgi:hypothetical protein
MDIFSIAWLAGNLPWIVYWPICLGLIALTIRIAAYGFETSSRLWVEHQTRMDNLAAHRRLNTLAITDTRRQIVTQARMQLVSKWEGADVEVELKQ